MKLYLKIHGALREAILSGAHAYGGRLPSKRETARRFGASLVTVEHAYRLLCDDGYAEARERSGFFAAWRPGDASGGAGHPCANVPTRVREDRHRLPQELAFPSFARAMRRTISRYGERILVKSPNMGFPELRDAIAGYLGRARGMAAKPERIVVGSGAEHLYSLLAKTFRGLRVAVEEPSYSQIRAVYDSHMLDVVPLKLAANGIPSRLLEGLEADVLHVTPCRSFPTGVSADASKRHEYLRWAERTGGILVEDDFDSEFSAAPRETLRSMAPGARIVYLNTFSKTIAPSIRAGYMVLPDALAGRYREAAGFFSCPVPSFEQFFLADFLASGDFERHLNRTRRRRACEAASPATQRGGNMA